MSQPSNKQSSIAVTRIRELEAEIERIKKEHGAEVEMRLAALPRTVAERRKSLQITQEQLASAAGVSRVQITNLEAGRCALTVERLVRIALHLNTTPDALLGFSKP